MALFNFTLTLSGVTSETERLEDILFESGCDDALVCFYGKSVYLEFDREAESLDAAIGSAIDNVESSGLSVRVESVDSVLVGLSDIAELTNMTRQAIALLKDGMRGKGDFPCPIQRIKGQSPLWDWASVAAWLHTNGRLRNHPKLAEHAQILSKWDLALRATAYGELSEIEAITHQIRLRRQQNCLETNEIMRTA